MAPALTEPHRPRATQTNLTRKRPSYVRIFFMVLQYDVGSHSKNFLPPFSRCFLTGSLTRNSSTDLTDFKTRNEKRKVYNALAAASIFKNSAGVDTSHRQVVPMDAFLHFLSHFQKEHLSEEEANQLIEVGKTFFSPFKKSSRAWRRLVFTVFENHSKSLILQYCERNSSKCRIWIFEFWHFPSFFVLLKLTCLVSLNSE